MRAQNSNPPAPSPSPSPVNSTGGDNAAPTVTPEKASPEATSQENVPIDELKISESELAVLQKLSQRRKELEERAKKLDMREALISASEQRLEQKNNELKALKALVEQSIKQRTEEQEKQMRSLVKMYEAMKPKDAAQIFEELDIDVLLEVVARMNERKVAPVLGLMTPSRAKEVTVELADRQKLPIAP